MYSSTYFYYIAEKVAKQSPCRKRKVGAVIVHITTGKIIATGFNKPGYTQTDCEDSAGNTYPETIHAEIDAMKNFKALVKGPYNTSEHCMYVTHKPCSDCYVRVTNEGFEITSEYLSPRLMPTPLEKPKKPSLLGSVAAVLTAAALLWS